VNRTLMQRTLNVSREELRDLVSQARGEWKRIIASHRTLRESRERLAEDRRQLEGVLAGMQGGSRGGPAPIEELESAGAAIREEEHLEHDLRKIVRALRVEPKERMEAENAVVERALEALREGRERLRRERVEMQADEVERLERRVAKLLKSLSDTEEVLRRLEAAKSIDVGLPSLYRVVQGLSDDEQNRELKRELLDAIFEANVELRRATEVLGR
jgi:chromosome segregation ATPase